MRQDAARNFIFPPKRGSFRAFSLRAEGRGGSFAALSLVFSEQKNDSALESLHICKEADNKAVV